MEADYNSHLGNRIIIVSNQVKHYLHHAAHQEGISGSQSRILHYLAVKSRETDVYQRDVEEFFCLRRSTVTQNLQTMEKNGLIRRCSVAHDARLKKLELTPEGYRLEERIHAGVRMLEEQLSASLTQEEVVQFNAIMEKMTETMEMLGIPSASRSCGEYALKYGQKGDSDVKDISKGN